jgi:hypothetical protein
VRWRWLLPEKELPYERSLTLVYLFEALMLMTEPELWGDRLHTRKSVLALNSRIAARKDYPAAEKQIFSPICKI